MGKPESKILLGRSSSRWDDVNKMDLHEVECGIMDWIEVAQDKDRFRALVNAGMKLPVPSETGNFT